MKKKIFKIIQTVAFVGLGLFLIVYFWGKLSAKEQNEIMNNFRDANYFWIVLAMIIGIVSHILRAARWNLLIETFDKPPTIGQTFWSVIAGYLANLAVPRLGEFTRCGLLSKQSKISFDKLLGSVVAERTFDMLVYLLLFASSIAVFYSTLKTYLNEKIFKEFNEKFATMSATKIMVILIVGALFILVFFWLLRFFREKPFVQKIRKVVRNLINGVLSIFKLRRVGLFFLYTIGIWIMYWLMVYLVYFSLPATSNLPPESAFIVMIYGTIGIILIQGGIGIYPIIVSEVLLMYGASLTDGYAIGWLSWSVQTALILILGLVAFIMVSINKKKTNGLPETDIR